MAGGQGEGSDDVLDGAYRPSDRRDTETLQFVFMHSPDGHPVCGVVPLIVGETEAAAKAACDELAAFGGGALVRQDTQLPYTALQAALDGASRSTTTTGTRECSSIGIPATRAR